MACFNEEDMKAYMSDLGFTITISDIDKEHEHHYVEDVKAEIKKSGIKSLTTRYAPLITLMKRVDKLKEAVQKTLVDIVNLVAENVLSTLKTVKDFETLTPEQLKQFQQFVGVTFFLSYTCLEEFSFFSRLANNHTHQKKRGRLSLVEATKRPFGFWVKGKDKLLATLSSLLKMNLLPIWDSNTFLVNKKIFYELIMLSLVNCVKCGARDIMRSNQVSDLILDIFEHFIKNMDMEDQLIRYLMFGIVDTEDMARAVCKILISLKRESNFPHIIRKAMLKAIEIIETPEHQDKLDKGFTIFLVEIGTACPEEIKEHSMPYVLQFSNSDVVALRNAVLSIIVEILQWNKSEIDAGKVTYEDSSNFRDKMLEYINDYICDDNAIVRSKTVNLLSKLVENKGLIIDELLTVCVEVGDRLMDSAAMTRKNSFNFFATLINAEPIIAKYTPSDFHEYALAQRRSFLEERLSYIHLDRRATIVNIYVKEFTDHINQTYMGKAILNRPLLEELKTPESACEHIHKLANELKIWDACECLFRSIKEYADTEVFRNLVNNHTLNVYRLFIGKEIGLDFDSLRADTQTQLNESANEVLETVESENSRNLFHHLHVCETISEILLDTVIPNALLLFEKGTSLDQIETLHFFASLSLFEYPFQSHVEGSILDVVSGLSRSVISNILEPFSLIFLKGADCETSMGLVKTIIALCDRLGPKKRFYIDFLVAEMVTVKKLHVPELKILWSIVTLNVPEMGHQESKIALHILVVCGKADRNSVHALFDLILEIPLGERGFADMEFAHLGLLMLNVLLTNDKESFDQEPSKLEVDSPVIVKTHDLIKYCLAPETRDLVNDHFANVIETGISLIYSFCIQPSTIITKIVEESYDSLFADIECLNEDLQGPDDVTYSCELNEKLLLKALVLAGTITACHSSYHAHTVITEVKKRKAFNQIDSIHKAPAVKRRLRRSFVEISARKRSSSNGRITFSNTFEDTLLKADNEELEAVIGQIGFDKEIETLRNYMESLLEKGVISFYWKFVQHICRRYYKLQNQKVRIATLRLFGFCMLIGTKAMEVGMEIFVKLWKHVTTPDEKIEMILMAVLLNDCYPNKMERCNELIITGLKSEYAEVRLMALDFVIFLTQDDVLKLRDILPFTIVCLADDCDEIREVTKNFLLECQEKDTMLHSAITDMVIRVSGNKEVSQENFRIIMQSFLYPFKKVSEVSAIVDKLVDRFSSPTLGEGTSSEDNAYCLSLLTYNERSFKILKERFNTYSKHMKNEVVYDCFSKILANARQNCKAELKDTLNEFESMLQDARESFTHYVK